MNMAKLNDFIKHLEDEVKNGSIYVWGAQGQGADVISEAWIKKMETSTTNAARAIALYKKRVAEGFGDRLRAFDCSGLGMAFLQNETKIVSSDMSADSMMAKCEIIKKEQARRGDWVFKVNASGKATHIGYIVDEALNVIEAKGRDYGVIKSPLSKGGWNKYGRPKYFADEINGAGGTTATAPEASGWTVRRLLKRVSPLMQGDDVRGLQRVLIACGYACGRAGADGIFGNDTERAVRAFQGSARLTVDGIAGRQTVTALGGTWQG
jgi:hypothetical protein